MPFEIRSIVYTHKLIHIELQTEKGFVILSPLAIATMNLQQKPDGNTKTFRRFEFKWTIGACEHHCQR